MWKKIVATSAATCLAFQIGLGAGTVEASDIKGHWAQAKMEELIDKRILSGDGNDKYFPSRTVTRAEMASFLVRSLGLQNVSQAKAFKDVKSTAWYAHSVAVASSYGLANGYTDGTFRPTANITRQEMASMLVSALRIAGYDTSKRATLNFKDTNTVASWAKSAVEIVYAYELMGGKTGFVFAPKDLATRAEAATVIYNLLYVDPTAPDRPKPGEKIVKSLPISIHYNTALNAQAAATPKVDGSGIFTASRSAVNYYLNPANFGPNQAEYYQYLKLNHSMIGLNVQNVNAKLLQGKGVLQEKAAAFVKAGQQYNINELYLISHALHETGQGTSKLSTGIEVGLDDTGKPTMVTEANRSKLKDIKVTYNMYGVGAIDAGPEKFGSERAYELGWFTVDAAIIGGAKFIHDRYIANGKDTLYKMRWNIERPGTFQYATHIQWATIAARNMHAMYVATDAITTAARQFEVPKYLEQPAASTLPPLEQHYAVDKTLAGEIAVVVVEGMNLNVRSYPSQYGVKVGELANETRVEIVGTNGNWYKVKFPDGKSSGWVSGGYIVLESEWETPVDPIEPVDPVPVKKASVSGVAGVEGAVDESLVEVEADGEELFDTSWVGAE